MQHIIDQKRPILGNGSWVMVTDYMGTEESICRAARQGRKGVSTDEELIERMIRDRHMSVFEQAHISLHIRCPIYVGRQLMRYRSAHLLELSGRYRDLTRHDPDEPDWFNPMDHRPWGSVFGDRMKTRSETFPYGKYNHDLIDENMSHAFTLYKDFLAEGVPREVARAHLPLATYTEIIFTIDLRNLLHCIEERTSIHAQSETRDYAFALEDIVKVWVPNIYKHWQNYIKDAVTLSAEEACRLRQLIARRNLRQYMTEDEKEMFKVFC